MLAMVSNPSRCNRYLNMAISRRKLLNWALPSTLTTLFFSGKTSANSATGINTQSNVAPAASGAVGQGKELGKDDTALRVNLKSSINDLGDALVMVKQPLPGAVARSQHLKNTDVVSVKDFGAIGDGITDDTEAVQAALDSGRDIFIPSGIFVCTQELEMTTHGQRIYGAGRGYGYNSNQVKLENGVIVAKWSSAVFNWRHVSTLLFKGSGIKRRRTRVLYRASAADPQDDAMSVCLNIQAEGTSLEHFCLFLDITPPAGGAAAEKTDRVTNLGANWDVGIFVGCRQNTNFNRMGVIGYHRKANVWYDVTQAINLPRFNSWRTGKPYPQGPVENGADGCASDGLFTSGGLWGINVQGANPKEGETTYSSPYYDAILGSVAEDGRGNWGFSDFLMINCQIFGANHHTRRRLVDMKVSPDAKLDWDVGGAFNIDGMTLNVNNVIHGHRYINCRFQSYAPFCVRLDRSARDAFFGCMIENPNTLVVKSRDGSKLALSPKTTFYGLCATDRHRLLTIAESQAPTSSAYTQLLYGDAQFANASQANPVTRTPYNRLEVLAEDDTTSSELRLGIIGSASKVAIRRATTGSLDMQGEGALVFRNAAGNLKMQIGPQGNAIFYGSAYPSRDNQFASGSPDNRWTNVHSASSTIVTSDDRCKTDKQPISAAVLRAWGKVNFMQYRLTDAIAMKAEKGEEARVHFGVIAQDVKAAFESEGLDPFAYGILCYDEWGDEFEPVIGTRIVEREGESYQEEYDTGEVQRVKVAGNRYGIRYEEALVLECAYLRSMLKTS